MQPHFRAVLATAGVIFFSGVIIMAAYNLTHQNYNVPNPATPLVEVREIDGVRVAFTTQCIDGLKFAVTVGTHNVATVQLRTEDANGRVTSVTCGGQRK